MLRLSSISRRLPKKAVTSFIMVSMAVFAFASMGGGGNKSKGKQVKGTEFTPIRTVNGFTLKAGPVYHGSMIFGQEKTNNVLSFNSVITYQKGNTTYILPYRYKMQSNAYNSKSSLQMLNLRLPIHK
jgi:hypothetical protein